MSFLKADKKSKPSPSNPSICRCNSITKSEIESCIKNGAASVDEIGDKCTAGMGYCGGTCRPKIKLMLNKYKTEGKFPSLMEIKNLKP